MLGQRTVALLLGCLLAATESTAQKKKNKKDEEPKPQVLEVLPETPDAIVADATRLTFQVSPLSAKGLLSQQIRDALKALDQQRKGATIVKLRAFVAGSGDMRRVRDIVAEEFTERHQPLPIVTTVQVGQLPMAGAQVVIESWALDRKSVNPMGVALLSALPANDSAGAIAGLNRSVEAIGAKGNGVLRVTCFLSSLDDSIRTAAANTFPMAAINLVQLQRQGVEAQAACEGVAKVDAASPSSRSTKAVVTASPKLVLTASQLVFRDQPADFRLAFQRLEKSMQPLGATAKNIVWTGYYALTHPNAAQLQELQWEFLDKTNPPAGTSLLFEGLPSTDATAAVELIGTAN